MPSLSLLRAFNLVNSGRFLMVLFTIHISLFTMGKPLVLPQHTAAHFCQLYVATDDASVSTLSMQAHRMIQPDDSLSVEQIYAGYILLADGWQTMRLFPHQEDDVVTWYSVTDELPANIDSEHQKYIREVFPRLIAEVQLEHWSTVDAYIDRMIQYQCQFGSSDPSSSSATIIGICLLVLALLILGIITFFTYYPKYLESTATFCSFAASNCKKIIKK